MFTLFEGITFDASWMFYLFSFSLCFVKEGKTALLGANECFLGVDEEDSVVAVSQTAGPEQMVVVRSNMMRYAGTNPFNAKAVMWFNTPADTHEGKEKYFIFHIMWETTLTKNRTVAEAECHMFLEAWFTYH